MNKAEELIACLEGEIAKLDETIARLEPQLNRAIQANYDLREELAACRVAVENCELFRARIAELEDLVLSLQCKAIESDDLRAELAAIKAQEPVAWAGVIEDCASLFVTEPQLWKAIPLYAAQVSEAKAKGVVQWPDADEIMQMAFEEGQPADDASGYCFELEEFDLFIERLMSEVARLNAAPSPAGAGEDDEYMPDGIVQGIMQSEEVDAVSLAAKSLKAAGVDGLEAVKVWEADADWDDHELVVRLSDATAIIDGLRGEVGAQRVKTCTALKKRNDAREERDAALVECERRQMQLAACGVVALANTIESAGEARQMHPDYMSASCSDVAGAVDREIALRTESDQQAQRIGELEGLLLRVQVSLSLDDTEWGYSGAEKYKLLADIRAAMSAGKDSDK